MSDASGLDARPLAGRTVVVTRAASQAGELRSVLVSRGAHVLEMPSMRIEPLEAGVVREAVASIADAEWIVFTSQNAVRITIDALRADGRDASALTRCRIACVGRTTSEALGAFGIATDVLPTRFVAEGLLEAMAVRRDVRGARILYLAAEGARDVLSTGLTALGANVQVAPIYRSVPDGSGAGEIRAALTEGCVSAVTFASRSAVRGYVDVLGDTLARATPAISIGPLTTAAIREARIPLGGEAREASMEALAEATALFLGGAGTTELA